MNTIDQNKEPEEKLKPFKLPLRYALLSKKLVIKGENRKECENLMVRILTETDPVTEIENILVEKIISSTWKLQRVMVIEKNLLNKQNEINVDEDGWDKPRRQRVRNIKKVQLNNPELQDLRQYQFELEKIIQKALEQLRKEQRLRVHKLIDKKNY